MKFVPRVHIPHRFARYRRPVFVVGVLTVLGGFSGRLFFSPATPDETPLFADRFPASTKYQRELEKLLHDGKLKEEDNLTIRKVVNQTSSIGIPSALLWCLLFQESRLNHLEGVNESHFASGLGQFSYFSFQEVNRDLNRFGDDNLKLLVSILGTDPRPIEPKKNDFSHRSSYYSIPTAVAASAVYLNNRYQHLKLILDEQKISYRPDLLWIYAAIAYNKGTRSVLTLWNELRNRKGTEGITDAVSNPRTFFEVARDQSLIERSLKRIWGPKPSYRYAKELRTHVKSVSACAIAPSTLASYQEGL